MSQKSRLNLIIVEVLIASLLIALIGRLFYLQVGAAPTYKKAALDIQSRDVIIPATRGLILDSSGVPLAMNKVGLAITVNRSIIDAQPDEGNSALNKISEEILKIEYAFANIEKRNELQIFKEESIRIIEQTKKQYEKKKNSF